MKQTKIKPCPCCGSKAETEYALFDHNLHHVTCTNIFCGVTTSGGSDSESQIAIWNKRVIENETPMQ